MKVVSRTPIEPDLRNGLRADDNSSSHLDLETMELVLRQQPERDIPPFVRRHLLDCPQCRLALRSRLETLSTTVGDESLRTAFKLLESADEWARMAEAGREATRTARAGLQQKGIRPVYRKAGVLVEELPDGNTRPVESAPPKTR